jgi:hypothetical protein
MFGGGEGSVFAAVLSVRLIGLSTGPREFTNVSARVHTHVISDLKEKGGGRMAQTTLQCSRIMWNRHVHEDAPGPSGRWS